MTRQVWSLSVWVCVWVCVWVRVRVWVWVWLYTHLNTDACVVKYVSGRMCVTINASALSPPPPSSPPPPTHPPSPPARPLSHSDSQFECPRCNCKARILKSILSSVFCIVNIPGHLLFRICVSTARCAKASFTKSSMSVPAARTKAAARRRRRGVEKGAWGKVAVVGMW
jgi:hypothetical protein